MMNSTKKPIVGAIVVVLILAYVSISQCNKHHNNNNHHHNRPEPCCADKDCIRIRYDSYHDSYDWYGGCCVIKSNIDTHCRSHQDGHLIVYAVCDYRYECFKRNSSSPVENEDKMTASLIKVNQTLLNPYIEIK